MASSDRLAQLQPQSQLLMEMPVLDEQNPQSQNLLEPNQSPYDGLMTAGDKAFISRIQWSQLSTQNAQLDDYYYHTYCKQRQEQQQQQEPRKEGTLFDRLQGMLYLPLPRLPETVLANRKPRVTDVTLAGALGKITLTTVRTPRQLLQVSQEQRAELLKQSEQEQAIHPTTDPIQQRRLRYQTLGRVEQLLEAVLERQDLEEQEFDNNSNHQQVMRQQSVDRLMKILGLSQPNNQLGPQTALCQILSLNKGRQAFYRASVYLPPLCKRFVFEHLLMQWDQFLAVQPTASQSDSEHFIQYVVVPLVPLLAEAPLGAIVQYVQVLLNKPLWVPTTKSGLLLLCVLMSRGDMARQESTTATDESQAWMKLLEEMYQRLQSHILSLFPLDTTSSCLYVWQFLALFVSTIRTEWRQALVLQVRDKVLAAVGSGQPEQIEDVNVFLAALGLDATQLA